MDNKINLKKRSKKLKLYKTLLISTMSGVLFLVPAVTIGVIGANNFVNNSNSDNNTIPNPPSNDGENDENTNQTPPSLPDNPNKPVPEPPIESIPEKQLKIADNVNLVTTFDDVLKGFDSKSNLSSAITMILNKDENKKKIISNYDDFENKQNIKITIPETINNGNQDWGQTKYNIWHTTSTPIVVNNYSESISIFSLEDFKSKLNDAMIKKLLKAGGLTNVDDLINVKLVLDSDIGIEKNLKSEDSNLTKDLIHINIQADSANRKTNKYDLGIPISNIHYDLNNIELIAKLDTLSSTKNSNLNIEFGIDPTVENTISQQIIIDSQTNRKDTVTTSELITQLGWNIASSSNTLRTPDNAIELDSNKIGKALGIYNVFFSNPIDTTPPENAIATDSYKGMSLTLDAIPMDNFKWEDDTKTPKKIVVSNLKVSIKDARVAPWCKQSGENRYGLIWSKMYKNNMEQHPFPRDLSSIQQILNNPVSFNEFWNVASNYEGYSKDFKSINMILKPGTIELHKGTENNSVYWFQANFKVKKGHLLIDSKNSPAGHDTLQENQLLYFRIQLN